MIVGEKVLLRGLELEDAKEIITHWNDLEVHQFIGRVAPITLTEEKEWVKRGWESRKKHTQYIFGIVEKTSNKLIGTCSFNSISMKNQHAGIGIVIWNKQYWNRGLGTDTMRLLLSYGFTTLGLNKLSLNVIAFNPRAYHVYKKVGFRDAGRLRNIAFFNGKYHDLIYLDILAKEYRENCG